MVQRGRFCATRFRADVLPARGEVQDVERLHLCAGRQGGAVVRAVPDLESGEETYLERRNVLVRGHEAGNEVGVVVGERGLAALRGVEAAQVALSPVLGGCPRKLTCRLTH